jgi:hypothetical protein
MEALRKAARLASLVPPPTHTTLMEAADAPDTASRASSAPGSRAPSPPTVPGDADPTSRSSGTPAAHLARAAATPEMQAGLLPANLTESEMFRQLMQQQQQSKEQLIELMQKQTIKLEHILQQNDHTHKQQTELLEIGRRTEARLREIDIEGKLKDQLVELRRCARLERSPVVCPGLTLRAPHSQILTPPSARCLCAGRSKPRGLPSSTPTPRPRRSRRSTRTSWTSSSWR